MVLFSVMPPGRSMSPLAGDNPHHDETRHPRIDYRTGKLFSFFKSNQILLSWEHISPRDDRFAPSNG